MREIRKILVRLWSSTSLSGARTKLRTDMSTETVHGLRKVKASGFLLISQSSKPLGISSEPQSEASRVFQWERPVGVQRWRGWTAQAFVCWVT